MGSFTKTEESWAAAGEKTTTTDLPAPPPAYQEEDHVGAVDNNRGSRVDGEYLASSLSDKLDYLQQKLPTY